MSYTPEQLAVLDPAAISKASPRHIQSVIDELIETVTAERAAQTENEALKERLAASGVEQRRAVREAVLAEREACAKVCDSLSAMLIKRSLGKPYYHGAGLEASVCADDIRARPLDARSASSVPLTEDEECVIYEHAAEDGWCCHDLSPDSLRKMFARVFEYRRARDAS